MYIRVKKRQSKNNENVFYLYLCESKRVEGKVTSRQRYLLSVKEQDLMNDRIKVKLNVKLSHLEEEVKDIFDTKVTRIMELLSSSID
ncbi:hypothetical protein [Paenibacillus aceris]|uniref:Arm DNA-binding domain-containing protein n=1 Tax=Paenibacillus aceris TaxID=869555 RepID=A0ABS4I3U0_9BACL|nr:hypothetical protein [Paenibacillus aceris]MBP1965186.1 hypothetical protein [Paenibacillus aceris]NHW33166.1 hypothetical protein [Paenibacillus aceris]